MKNKRKKIRTVENQSVQEVQHFLSEILEGRTKVEGGKLLKETSCKALSPYGFHILVLEFFFYHLIREEQIFFLSHPIIRRNLKSLKYHREKAIVV